MCCGKVYLCSVILVYFPFNKGGYCHPTRDSVKQEFKGTITRNFIHLFFFLNIFLLSFNLVSDSRIYAFTQLQRGSWAFLVAFTAQNFQCISRSRESLLTTLSTIGLFMLLKRQGGEKSMMHVQYSTAHLGDFKSSKISVIRGESLLANSWCSEIWSPDTRRLLSTVKIVFRHGLSPPPPRELVWWRT